MQKTPFTTTVLSSFYYNSPCTSSMKPNQKTIATTICCAIIFFTIGQIIFFRLFAFFEPSIAGIKFQIIERPARAGTSILFSLLLAVLPVLIVTVWWLGRITSLVRRTGSILLMVVCMIAGILLRHYAVKNYFINIVRPFLLAKHQLPMNYPIDPVNFVYYMFGGLCIGGVVAVIFFQQRFGFSRTSL